jgi:hypothetical protein
MTSNFQFNFDECSGSGLASGPCEQCKSTELQTSNSSPDLAWRYARPCSVLMHRLHRRLTKVPPWLV